MANEEKKQEKKDPINPKKVLQNVADVLTEKPSMIEINVKPKDWFERWLIKRKIKPSKRFYEIKPQRVQNIYRIAGRAQSFDVKGIIQDIARDNIGTLMKVMAKHGEDITYIVATAIQNDHREPTDKMLDIVRNEFEMDDVATVLQVAVSNYNINAFLNSIVLIVGVDALELQASPVSKGS